jgi:hypothetical protein
MFKKSKPADENTFLKFENEDFFMYSKKKELKKHPDGKISINGAKLRISVPINKFYPANDIILKHLLAEDSPIDSFKVVNMEDSEKVLKTFNKNLDELSKLREDKENKYDEDDVKRAELEYEALFDAREDFCRLMDAGQWTLYLPDRMNKKLCVQTAYFLKNIINDLIENDIPCEECPSSDRHLFDYISGRAWEDNNGHYIEGGASPDDSTLKNHILGTIEACLRQIAPEKKLSK